MRDNEIEFMALRHDFSDGIDLYARKHEDDNCFVATALSWAPYTPGSIALPFHNISTTAAQQLMDELWRCGVRPTEAAGSAGAMAATQKHLEDMRTISMGLLAKHGVGK